MELYASHDYVHRPFIEFDKQLLSWKNLFLAIDKGLKLWEKTKLKPLRRSALQRIEEWILKRADGQRSDGSGRDFPSDGLHHHRPALPRIFDGRSHASKKPNANSIGS